MSSHDSDKLQIIMYAEVFTYTNQHPMVMKHASNGFFHIAGYLAL